MNNEIRKKNFPNLKKKKENNKRKKQKKQKLNSKSANNSENMFWNFLIQHIELRDHLT